MEEKRKNNKKEQFRLIESPLHCVFGHITFDHSGLRSILLMCKNDGLNPQLPTNPSHPKRFQNNVLAKISKTSSTCRYRFQYRIQLLVTTASETNAIREK